MLGTLIVMLVATYVSLLFTFKSCIFLLLPTARGGYVFRSVCQSFCSTGEGGESASKRVCLCGRSASRGGGVCLQGGLHPSVSHSVHRGLHPRRSASRGVCIKGREGSASRGSAYGGLPKGGLPKGDLHPGGVSLQEGSASRGFCI